MPSDLPSATIDDIERAIHDRQGRKIGSELVFLCPVHDERHPSARWNPEKQTWWCHCGAKGGAIDLARRLDVSLPEMEAKPSKIVKTYHYTDEKGDLLFQVNRWEPKRFTQQQANGTHNLEGVRRVPYNLVKLMAFKDRPVLVVEGEKDADALGAMGYLATCNPGGAGVGKWRPEYNAYLTGRMVYLLPDNDEPGRGHMAAVRASLLEGGHPAERVATIILPGLPDKGDVSDWIAAGGTKEELDALLLSPPRDGYKAAEQVVADAPDAPAVFPTGYVYLDQLLLGGLRPGQLVVLAARPGVGKSALGVGLAYQASVQGRKAYLFSLEMSEQEVADRLENHGQWEPSSIFIDERGDWDIKTLSDQARLANQNEGGLDLLIIDYLQLMSGTGKDGNRVQDLGAITRGLKQLAKELGIPIVALAQLNRGIESRGEDGPRKFRLSDLRESGSVEQDANIVLFLDREGLYNEEYVYKNTATINVAKNRGGPLGTVPIGYEAERTRFYDLATA